MRGNTYQINHLITQTVEANKHTIYYKTEEATVLGQIFTQTYSLTKAIKKFGDKGFDAALAEVKQLHYRRYFRPIDLNNLTSQ